MNEDNAQEQDEQELTTADGRKITSFSAAGESYTIESTEQTARGRQAEIEAEIAEIKLKALRRGVQIKKLR